MMLLSVMIEKDIMQFSEYILAIPHCKLIYVLSTRIHTQANRQTGK